MISIIMPYINNIFTNLDNILESFFRLLEVARPVKSDLVREILDNPQSRSEFLDKFYEAIESESNTFSIEFKGETLEFHHD